MTKTSYPAYALIAAGAVAFALWAGMPPVYLLILACPAMMLFMMRGMNGSQRQDSDDDKTPRSETTSPETADRPR